MILKKKNLSSTSFEFYAPPLMIFGDWVELGLKVVGVLVRLCIMEVPGWMSLGADEGDGVLWRCGWEGE